jgi:hypothetical protein
VIRNTSQLSQDDRAAMAVYIKSLPPVDGPPKSPHKSANARDCGAHHGGRLGCLKYN